MIHLIMTNMAFSFCRKQMRLHLSEYMTGIRGKVTARRLQKEQFHGKNFPFCAWCTIYPTWAVLPSNVNCLLYFLTKKSSDLCPKR